MLLIALRWLVAHVYNFIHNNKFAPHIIEVAGLILAVALGFGIWRHYQPHYTETVVVPGAVKTVVVDRPVLTEKIVTKVLTDPKDKALIAALLAENDKLKLEVTSLSHTIAEFNQTGGGVVEPVQPVPGGPIAYHFKDWHLDFTTDTKTANYSLAQKFEVLTSTGRDKDGAPATLVKLFEIGANGERIPVTSLKTTGIFANATNPHWLLHLNVQGGVGFTRDNAGVSAPGGIVAVQWLKHGRTKAAEDVSYAILSPAFLFGPNVQDIGLLPFSLNLGRIPHQPLTNVWLSPYISKSNRLGVAFTATF